MAGIEVRDLVKRYGEPTTGLDPHGRRDTWGAIRQVHAQG